MVAYKLQTFCPSRDVDDNENECSRDVPEQSQKNEGSITFDKVEDQDESIPYTIVEQTTVLKKLDKNLVLFLALLYMLSFLDRSNIGNARIAGLMHDLGIGSSQYEWLLTAFYITYILFEWTALFYGIIPAHIYISICVAGWGFIASCQSISGSFADMLVLRALLGVAEAAFGPGIPFYLSFFYQREELAFRTGLFISAAPLATSFASTLAWAITLMGKNGRIASWRLLFLIEGFPSMLVAAVGWYHIPDTPGDAWFLDARERDVARRRLENRNKATGHRLQVTGLEWKELKQTALDPKCYLTALMFFCCNVAFSSLPPFLPTIINEMKFSAITSQILSAPPYLVSFATVLLTASLSDRLSSRGLFIALHSVLAALGYSLIAIAGHLQAHPLWRYAGVFPAATGFFSAVTLIITWTINNQPTNSGRGMGVTILNIIGQLGPFVGTRLYPDSDKPYFVKGNAFCAGFMLLVAVFAFSLRLYLARLNEASEPGHAYLLIGRKDDVDTRTRADQSPMRHAETTFLYIL